MSRITDLPTSVYESFAMLAGMQLAFFSLLADRPQTVGELASHLTPPPSPGAENSPELAISPNTGQWSMPEEDREDSRLA